MTRLFFKLRKALALFISGIIPLKNQRRAFRKKLIEAQFYSKKYAFEDSSKFPFYLSILAAAKNEGSYLEEWIEYHHMLGVERFFLFDNESTDNTRAVLEPYIKSGLVVYNTFSFVGDFCPKPQQDLYTRAVKKYRNQTKWMAIIDIDEFIVPIKHNSIPDFLRGYEEFSQIMLHYKFFGAAGHKTRPAGLVLENYLYARQSDVNNVDTVVNSNTGKSILNPRAVVGRVFEHYSPVIGMPVDERKMPYLEDPSTIGATTDIIEVNHYWEKSEEECAKRFLRNEDRVKNFYTNAQMVYNDDVLRFVPKLKERLSAKRENV
ncbi:MAG: glycosyltransferase family 92 protein [Elusimicrobiota bacterium]|jgi:hypothetical protein|nr:glycosyltransferase family 92 protein [Elusimicrobiota bacterium]